MEQQSSPGKSVAWFKLAQMVGRGEKEKAIGLYRLLSYSFDDKAFSLQVEGDILWAFADQEAVEKYKQAAFLYKKEQKMASAVAVYEHLHAIEPRNSEYLSALCELYAMLNWQDRLQERAGLMLAAFKEKAVNYDQLTRMIQLVAQHFADAQDSAGAEEFKAFIEKSDKTLARDARHYFAL